MDYLREHIRRYAAISIRRTLGIGLITLCVALTIGLAFTILSSDLFLNIYGYLAFWIILLAMAGFTFLSSVVGTHISSVKYMNEIEHTKHSKQMGIWVMLFVIGVCIFLIPLFFVSSYLEPITILFSLGGILFVIFLTIMLIMKQKYGELAIGGAALWLMAALGFVEVGSPLYNVATKSSFSIYFTTMCITIITGFIGLTLLFISTREALYELRLVMNYEEKKAIKNVAKPKKPKARRRR